MDKLFTHIKKTLLILSFFVISGVSFAGNYYWVGNSGNWNDAAHWSAISGGQGGIGIPSQSDDIIIDRNSFTTVNQTILLTGNVSFHDFKILNYASNFKLKAATAINVRVFGVFDINSEFKNELSGTVSFKSTTNDTKLLNLGRFNWNTDFVFEGKGKYELKNPILTPQNSVHLVSGELNLNTHDIVCNSFISNSGLKRKLVSQNADILTYNEWKTTKTKFNYDFSQSKIYVLNAALNAVDKDGDNYSVYQSQLPNNSASKTITSITIFDDTVSCGNSCDGMLYIDNVATDCSPYTVTNWVGVVGPPAGGWTDTVTGLCPGSYTAVVMDNCGFISGQAANVLGHPPVLPISEIVTPTSCNGVCDGSVKVTIIGASYASYTYTWTPTVNVTTVFTTTSDSNLCAGIVTLQVQDGFGCDTTFTYNVPQPDSLFPNVTVTDPLCFGDCTGSAVSNPSGGTAPFSYSWTPPTGNPAVDTAQSFPNLCANTPYTIAVTDANGCFNDTTVTPNQPPQIVLDTVTQNVSCGGVCDGQITVTVLSGGVGPFTHNWSTGQIDVGAVSTVINLCFGNYSDSIVDANGCDTVINFTISEPTPLITNTVPSNVKCFGACDGQATTFPSGGAGGYTYSWSCGPSTFDSIVGLCPTPQCIVTITDANLCTVQDTFAITEPLQLAANASSTDVTCPGFCDGTATVTPSGGTGNPAVDYTYVWTGLGGPYNTQSISSLCPGTYFVTVTDSNGCTALDTVVITQPNPLNLVMSSTDVGCAGICDGTAAVTVTGGNTPYVYVWVPDPTVPNGQGTDSIFNLCAGNYTVNVTDAGNCTANNSVTVNPQIPIVDNLVTSNLSCNAVCNGSATVSPTGGVGPYTVSWDGGAPIVIPIAGSNTINNLCAGPHTGIITDANGCTLNVNFNLTQPPALTTSTATTDVSCFGLCDGIAVTTPAGGTAPYTPIIWTPLNPAGAPFPDPANNLCAGTYFVTVTDDSLCTVNDTITIFEPLEIFPNATFTDITCNGLNNGTAISIPTGGAPGYTYTWNGPSCSPCTSQSIGPLAAGQYILTVTDTNGCTGLDTVLITDPIALTVNASATNASCGTVCDGMALATPNGGTPGFTYQWTDASGNPIPGGVTASNLCAGIYTVVVADTNGCTAQDTTEILPLITITINPTIIGISCNGVCDGTATVFPVGGTLPYSYQWAIPPNTPADTFATITGLCPGFAVVTVTDALGCATTDSVNMPTAPTVLVPNDTLIQPISCNGACDAIVTHSPTGGTPPYISVWTLPNGIDTNNVCPTFATITVTDANNCVASATINITEPDTITPNATIVNLTCNGNNTGSISLAPTGGTPGYAYVWTPNVSSGSSATGLAAGSYQIQITDTNGCSRTDLYIITEPAPFTSNPIGVNVSCFGSCDGMAAVTVAGGTAPYAFNWSPNGETNDTIFNLCAPNLTNTVTVTDSNNCITSQTITITEPTLLTLNVTGTPEDCTNPCTGTAVATPNGGTTPYSYQWSNNALPNNLTNPSINNLCPDSFNVVVTDTNGCTANGFYIVTTPTGLNVTLDSTNITCNGLTDGTATANLTGGTAPFIFSWVGPACNPSPGNTAVITGLCAGVYTLTVTDSAGCIFIGSVNIVEPTPIDDNEVITGANCGVCDGSIVTFPSGGTPSYSHSWSNGIITPNNLNLCAGFYTDTITDFNGCVSLFTIGVSNPTGPSGVTATVNNATCNGTCDGSLNAIPIGGTAPFTFTWTSNPAGGPYPNDSTLTGLCAGTYSLTLTDSGGCILATNIVIGEATIITANSTFTAATCNGNCDGTASVTPTGGTPPYTYLWSHDGSTASSASNLCVGAVSVTITDFAGCTSVVNFNISSPNALTITGASTNVTCNGNCDGSATANPAGGTAPFAYQWNDAASQTTQTATGLCVGTYIVTVTDFNGCSGNDTINITEPSLIVPNTVTTQATCGNSDGTANVCASSGGTGVHTYNWPTLGNVTLCSVSGLAAGTYPVEITDANGCTQTFQVTISNVGGPSISVNSTNASCNGVCDGQATVTVLSGTPNYTYLWSSGGQTTPTITGLCAGSYSVQVTDGNGCSTVLPVTIIDNASITATVSTIDATCNGVCNGSALVVPSGGVPPYSFSWVGGPVTGQTTNAVGGLCAGNYTVTITDANLCSLIQNVTINEPNILSVTIAGIAANCPGSCDGQATATPNGGTGPYTYNWSNGASTPIITALCAGNYSVTVTDANGCSGVANVAIGDGIAITAGIVKVDATCGLCDGSITITPGGGSGAPYNFLWSPGGQTTPTISNLCPGAYTVTIGDNVSCSQNFTILISNPNGPSLTTQADSVTCFGSCDGLAYTTVTAGNPNYVFQWDDPNLQTNDSATALCAGLYTVVVQDALGCITVDSASVPEPQQILANITFTNPTCAGVCDGTVLATPTGGTAPFVIVWNNGTSNLCAGNQIVTITDAKGCMITDSITLTDPTPISITISSTPVSCNGSCDGTALANASGGTPGYQYSWNTVPPLLNSIAAGLCPGTYIVTVTDNNSCSDTASVVVINPPLLSTTSTPTSPACNGVCNGSITTNPSGGVGPYTYLWSNGETTQNTSATLCAGIYNVIVVDANNCTAYDTINLLAPAILNDSTVITQPTCGICNGSATSTPTGSVGPFDFVWSDPLNPIPALQTDNGVLTSTVNGLCAGSLDLQITDQSTGCIYNYTILVNSANGPNLALTATDETCPNSCDGTATAIPTGGTTPYSYNWTPTPPINTNQTATNLCVGLYTVTVTDSVGCISVDTISINSTTLGLSITSVIPESCFGNCDGSATVAVANGVSPFQYLWNPTGQTTPTASNLCSGIYVVTVTDSTNCADSISTTITGPTTLTVVASVNSPVSCNGICDGTAIANVLGGSPNYTYAWNDPLNQTTQIATGLCAGTYIVVVTDNNGCTATDTVIIAEPTAILDNSTLINPNCGICDGAITVAPTGGFGPYTFLWTTPSSPPSSPQPITALINNLCAGPYTLVITDSSGCIANFAYPLSNVNAPLPNTTVTNVSCNSLCDGSISSVPSGGTPPYSYFWNPSGDTTTGITNLCSGQYTLNVTDAAGCIGIAIDSVTQPAILQANINSANISCNGACDGWAVSNTLGGTTPYTYNWTPGNLTTDSITNLCIGTYVVAVTDSNSCTVVDSVTLIEPTLITSIATQVDVTCTANCDGSATVTPAGGVGPYTFQWNGNVLASQSSTQTGLCFGLNTVEIFDQNGCSVIDSINIGATDTVLANAGPDSTICFGSNIDLAGIPSGNFTSVEWFELPSMTSLGTTDTINVTPSLIGTVCYAFQVNGACSFADTVCITTVSLPAVNAGPDVTIIEGGSTILTATGGGTYTWTPGSSLSDSTIANPTASPNGTTTYIVTTVSANGCISSDTVVVTVLPAINFPDGITPNGDGKNDFWIIDFIEQYPENVVEIYNRWGELLFHADGYQQNWEGKYKGQPLPIGTYYYVIDLHDDLQKPFTGPITILR